MSLGSVSSRDANTADEMYVLRSASACRLLHAYVHFLSGHSQCREDNHGTRPSRVPSATKHGREPESQVAVDGQKRKSSGVPAHASVHLAMRRSIFISLVSIYFSTACFAGGAAVMYRYVHCTHRVFCRSSYVSGLPSHSSIACARFATRSSPICAAP